MSSQGKPAGSRVCIAALAALTALVVGLLPANGDPFSGQSYQYGVSGSLGGYGPYQGSRTFGSAPTTLSSGAMAVMSLSDALSTQGLGPNQARLTFTLSDLTPLAGTGSGIFGNPFWPIALSINGIQLPQGADLLPATAGVTYSFDNGPGPVAGTILPDSKFGPGGSMLFVGTGSGAYPVGNDWPVAASFEIVVDNVPEPVTISLLAAGALGLVGTTFRKTRRPA